ncbi:SPOR domain-containing protein [Pseudomonas mangrovi]|jgi:cell division protein FtsN|uniref:Cell division protein n=1 Tax=Pseudomonas mangrovi TaxID=2161748 RepID=A0A2T5P5A7_9PSED|nr:SPOR domain-containing protein [Pseudomonas mangrovi]PTU72911.1 cell division protein [Pseudomonas mangrovi]
MATTKKKAAPKRGASRYQAPARKPVPGWIWLVCGLVIGGFLVMLASLEPGREDVRRAQPDPKRTAPTQTKPNQPAQPTRPKYEFYTLLPESEVIIPPDAMPTQPEQKPVTPEEAARIDRERAEAALAGKTPAPPPLVTKSTTQFYLQAGSFRQNNEADRVRAQIILLGQNARIESGKVREELWHRVLVGPFATREQLTEAQKELAASGFGNLMPQQRQVP